MFRYRLPLLSFAVVLASCAATTNNGFNGDDSGAPQGGDAGDGAAPGFDGNPPDVFSLGDGQITDTGGQGFTLVYAHDNGTLYKVDPKDPALAITTIGAFDCVAPYPPPAGMVTSLTDIAIDKDGKLYGIASQMVFLDMTINGSSVGCKSVGKPMTSPNSGSKAKFYGASFAPAGTVDPANETLIVGNTDGELYQVNTTTGALTIVGNFGVVPADDTHGNVYANAGQAWELSGDIVFLANNGDPVGFATVRDCPTPPATTNCNTTDTLIELDMTKLKLNNTTSVTKSVRGEIVKAATCNDPANTGYGGMYGIAAFADKVIGFSHSGFIVSISNVDGTACLIADDKAQLTPGFDGAGVSTKASIIKPPPK